MTAVPLNIDTKRLPPTPQWSPILSHSQLSPRSESSANSSDLSSRCRKLARSFGEHALVEDFDHQPGSPARSRENSAGDTAPALGAPPSPLSPNRRHSHLPMSPPIATPEGSHVLNEILEEESEPASTNEDAPNTVPSEAARDEVEGVDEPMQFKLSPVFGNQMSLHGASLAMEGVTAGPPLFESGLGLSLHEQFKLDTEQAYHGVEVEAQREGDMREELKKGTRWMVVDLTLIDGELIVGSPQSPPDISQTFSNQFVEPLLRILSEANSSLPSPLSFPSPHHRRLSSPSPSPLMSPSTPISTSSTSSSDVPTISRPLHLVLNLHSSPSTGPSQSVTHDEQFKALSIMLHYVQASLEPLHDEQMLCSYCPNSKLLTKGPIMVLVPGIPSSQAAEIGEGRGGSMVQAGVTDEMLDSLQFESPRTIFRPVNGFAELDGSLNVDTGRSTRSDLDSQSHPVVIQEWSPEIFGSQGVQDEAHKLVERVHEKGFSLVVSGTPRFPEHEAKSIEAALKRAGVDHVAPRR